MIWITLQLTRLAHYRHMLISPNFNKGVEAVRPDRPLNGSYQKVSTVALFLLDCIGLLPILGHLIGEAAAYAILVPKKHSQYL